MPGKIYQPALVYLVLCTAPRMAASVPSPETNEVITRHVVHADLRGELDKVVKAAGLHAALGGAVYLKRRISTINDLRRWALERNMPLANPQKSWAIEYKGWLIVSHRARNGTPMPLRHSIAARKGSRSVSRIGR